MRLTLAFLAGMLAMKADSTEDQIADELERALPAARQAQAHAAKLETDLSAANVRVTQLIAERDAALLALESAPPVPAAAAKYKAGDKVLYRDGEKTITTSMGPEIVYEFETGECGPESRCEPIDGPVAVAFNGSLRVLTAFAARVPGHTFDTGKLAALARAAAGNPAKMAEAIAQIEASVPKDAKAKAAANAALTMLQPAASAPPASDRQTKIRNRVGV